MSIPIYYCALPRALDHRKAGDDSLYRQLVGSMRHNIEGGHWMMIACPHSPRCREPTEAEIDQLEIDLAQEQEQA